MSRQSELAQLGRVFDTGPLSNRNLIINGAMNVAQRGTSYTYSSGNSIYTTVDRFKHAYFGSWGSNHSEITQEADGPNGFQYSCKVKALSAESYASVLGSWVQHNFENQNLIALQNGSGLKDFTVSLWLKSNKTGNVTISVEGEYYSYSTYVTINSASTWEYKTVTFPATTLNVGVDYTGDPSGGDFNLKIGLGSNGSWLVDVDDQWNDKSTNRGVLSPQQTNFQANVNDYLQFTGVQLEVGDTATPFEHRSYGDELARCQRYYWKWSPTVAYQFLATGYAYLTTKANVTINWPVEMRASPTLSSSGNFRLCSGSCINVTSFSASNLGKQSGGLECTASGLTVGQAWGLGDANDTSAYLAWDAEL